MRNKHGTIGNIPTAHLDEMQSTMAPPSNGADKGRGGRLVGRAANGDVAAGRTGEAAKARQSRLAASRRSHAVTLLDHFRRIYLSIQPAENTDVPLAIGVTSAVSGEGRTTVATGMASAMAADLDLPVVLVEVDLAHPGVHRLLDIAPVPGISEYLRGECDIGVAVRQVSDRLFVLPAGDSGGEAARLIRQLTTADLRARLDSSGAILVFDLPPILDSSYGVLAATMAESLVFVVRAGRTTSPQVKDALGRLDEGMIGGLVLNGATPFLPRWLRGS